MKHIVIIFLLISNFLISQNELNQWRFGRNCGLDFNSGNPIPVSGSAMNTMEGVSSIADASGNLLFYTDGVNVWNRNNLIMPNGTGLLGHASSSQSSVIVQRPLNTRYYYVFTVSFQNANNGVRYSIVDMNANGGLGDIITKNVLLHDKTSEKICIVRHCNNIDFWVVTRDVGRSFRTWLVTNSSISSPVISNISAYTVIDDITTSQSSSKLGQLKANMQGNRLGVCYYDPINVVTTAVFNNSTGVVSNEITLSTGAVKTKPYGCEFSPNGSVFYVGYNSGQVLHQYNLCVGTPSISRLALATTAVGFFTGSFQLATNGKIYFCRQDPMGTLSTLSVINDPDVVGPGCNLSLWTVPTNCSTTFGLPNNAQYYLKPYKVPFTHTKTCNTVNFYLPTMNSTNCLSNINLLDVQWDFGDGQTSNLNNPVHTYINPGFYNVNLYLTFNCYKDTINSIILINFINVNLQTD